MYNSEVDRQHGLNEIIQLARNPATAAVAPAAAYWLGLKHEQAFWEPLLRQSLARVAALEAELASRTPR